MILPPRLSEPEQSELIHSMRNGDRSARDKLIESHFSTACRVASRFRHSGIERDDLISLACIGLIYAVDHFDPSCGTKLQTNVWWAASKYIHNEIRDRKLRLHFAALSLNDPISGVRDDHDGNTHMDGLASDDPDPLDQVVLSMEAHRARKAVQALPDQMRQIITMRYLEDSGISQLEVGNKLGISQMTVCRREREALAQCRRYLERS